MPNALDEIRYYGKLVVKLEKSTDEKSKGALRFFKFRLDEAVRKYVREEVA